VVTNDGEHLKKGGWKMSDYIVASTHVDTQNEALVFDSEGYYVVGDGNWQDITFNTTLTFNGGNIGIAPRVYATNFYMFLSIYNEEDMDTGQIVAYANLNVQETYETFHLDSKKLDPLDVGQDYAFKVIIKGTNYRIYLNDVVIFNIEYPNMIRGSVGIYSTAGNSCKNLSVDSNFADGWFTNIDTVPGGIADIQELDNEDKYLYLNNPTTTDLYAGQTLTVVGGKAHTLSFNYIGSCTVTIFERDGASPQVYSQQMGLQSDWTEASFTQTLSADCATVEIRFMANNETVKVNNVQLEDKGFATDYIHNMSLSVPAVRDSSIITYPSKDNILPYKGSLAMWFKPDLDYDANTAYNTILFEYGDTQPLLLYYSPSGSMRFKYGSYNSIGITMNLVKDTWYNAVATWDEDEIQLWIGTSYTSAQGVYSTLGSSNVIRIGWSQNASYRMFNGVIDETVIYSEVLSDDEAVALADTTDPIADNDSVILHASFNHAIANFNKSIIEATLAPNYGSPVIVTKQNGSVMRKVSFFDWTTGEYRTFNQEPVMYDKAYDYLPISYHADDIDKETFTISVTDEEGVMWGDPLTLDGKKVHMTLTDDQKDVLDGQTMTVSYQLEESYTVDFNIGVPDSFRVTLGKYDGEPVTVTYEGNRFSNQKLATMIELNPLLNPNHEGFLYITQNVESVSSFRVRATPDNLPANGGTQALIVAEPLDSNGNYISHCKLTVSCELGTILPTYDEDSVKIRERAGRFLYQYRPPIIEMSDVNAVEVEDHINIMDSETGLGVQIPITLKTLETMDYTLQTGDTIEKIAAKYGATIQDIAYTDDMIAKVNAKYGANTESVDKSSSDVLIANARKYISESSNVTIKIPVSYSASQLQKSAIEINYDKMIAYLLEFIIDYMGQPKTALPSGLGDLLDFNGDGVINMDEVAWLTNNRLTTTLTNKYTDVLNWDKNN
jgi:hypothetical protein